MSEKTKEGAIRTYTGKLFSPLWPTPDTIHILDIVKGLMVESRFSGQTLEPYFVLQHCIIGTRWFRKRGMIEEARWFLLHESSEGLGLKDLPTPIKYLPEMSAYRNLCKNVDYAVYRKFGLLGERPAIVKELDTRMRIAEAKVLFDPIPEDCIDVDTSDLVIKPYKRLKDAEKYFLKEFKILFPEYALDF